jgi:EmrB/QacA subfamily drug resistance transporter
VSTPAYVGYASPQGRAVVLAATLGSGMTILDSTVVNIALRAIGKDLDASLAELQWITNGYLLSLASLILLGGALGDRYGRRRMFVVGTIWFALASFLCGLATTPLVLIVARILQGVGAALLTPGSLSIIQSVFAPIDRAKAIGAWSGLGGVAAALGPFVGGTLIQFASWRWIFLINLPLAVFTVMLAQRWVPETRDPDASRRFDVTGAILATVALAGVTYALIQWGSLVAGIAAAVGLIAGIVFVVVEARSPDPLMPLELFGSRLFSAANAMTLLVYAALGAVSFFLVLQLQTVAGYGALEAGVATLPITLALLFLAARAGALGTRIGPRIPMTVGPLVMAVGTLMLLAVDDETSYWIDVLPGLTLFGLGLALMVAPLTATVLAAAPDRHAGIASGVNNAVARAGALLAIAAFPMALGLSGGDYDNPAVFDDGYRLATISCAVLLALGGLISWATIRAPR